MQRAWVWVGLVSFCCSGCWYFEDCPDNVNGIQEGKKFETTIIGPFAGHVLSSSTPSCGALGDLDAGAAVAWTAVNSGSAETCDDQVECDITGTTSGEVRKKSILTYTLSLPSGCSGEWRLKLKALRSDADFTRAPPDPAKPSWVVERLFTPQGDITSCPAELTVNVACGDAFVASNAAL